NQRVAPGAEATGKASAHQPRHDKPEQDAKYEVETDLPPPERCALLPQKEEYRLARRLTHSGQELCRHGGTIRRVKTRREQHQGAQGVNPPHRPIAPHPEPSRPAKSAVM